MESGKRWEVVRGSLLNDIQEARMQPGDKLPNDLELAERFGVNRHTVRHAIKSMESDGVLRVVQGRGTFVAEDATTYLLSPRTRLTENLLSQGLLAHRQIIGTMTVEADVKLAEVLQLPLGDKVLRIDTLSFHDDIPRTIAHNHFPMSRTPNLLDAFFGTNSVSDALKRIGIDDFSRQWTRINARLPTEREAELLQMSRSRPVFETENLDTQNETPIKYGENVLCAERVTFAIDFNDLREARLKPE